MDEPKPEEKKYTIIGRNDDGSYSVMERTSDGKIEITALKKGEPNFVAVDNRQKEIEKCNDDILKLDRL